MREGMRGRLCKRVVLRGRWEGGIRVGRSPRPCVKPKLGRCRREPINRRWLHGDLGGGRQLLSGGGNLGGREWGRGSAGEGRDGRGRSELRWRDGVARMSVGE